MRYVKRELKQSSIKRQQVNYLEDYRIQRLKVKKLHFIQKVHMGLLNYTLTGLQLTIANHMISLHVMESYLIMNPHVVEKPS